MKRHSRNSTGLGEATVRASSRKSLTAGLFLSSFLLVSLPGESRADWWDVTGDSVCGPEETTGLAVFLAEEEPRTAEAGPASTDHSRSLQIFRGRYHGLVPSEELNEYLTGVLHRILEAGLGDTPPPYRVYATTSGEFNAAAMPDGAIFLPIGLLHQLKNEDELAFVLGHEAAHILLAHHASDWFVESQYYAYLSWAAADNLMQKLSELHQSAAGIAPGWANEMAALQLIYSASENIAHPLWQQEQEDCADLLGFDLMVKAGYNAAAATTFLRKLQSLESTRDDAFASLENGETIENPWQLFERLSEALTAATQSLVSEISNHPDAEERIEALAAYYADYAMRTGKPPRPSRIRQLAWQKEPAPVTRTILANYGKAFEALRILNDLESTGKDKAATLALESIKGPTKDHGLPWYSFATLRRSQSRLKDYQENLTIGQKRSGEPSLLAYTEMVNQKLAADPAGTLPLLQEVNTRFDNSPLTLPLQIRILAHNDRMKEARALVPKCLEYDIRGIHEQCRKEARMAEGEGIVEKPEEDVGESGNQFLNEKTRDK